MIFELLIGINEILEKKTVWLPQKTNKTYILFAFASFFLTILHMMVTFI